MKDTVVLVTGGASGLGRGIGLVMAERGADVAVADIDWEGAKKVRDELALGNNKVRAYQVDVTKTDELETLVRDVLDGFGRIDVLVNSAGVVGAPGYEDTTRSRIEDWELTLDVNVMGTVLATEAVTPYMIERRNGKIVNVASHAGRGGARGNAAYGSSKASVIHLTQSYALELAPYNINVNVVCPGTIWTPMWERIAERVRRNDPSKRNLTTRQIFDDSIQQRCPLNRGQTPEDIGKAVAFFASEDAKNITGQSLNVNGGTRMN